MSAALDSNANNVDPYGLPRGTIMPGDLRQWRWNLRDGLREVSTLERVRKCGRVMIGQRVSLRVAADGSGAGYAGLATCGSVWADPVCAAKVALRRGLEVAAVVDWWMGQGGRVIFPTATVRHHAGMALGDLLPGVMFGWRHVQQGKTWRTDKERLGLVGYSRALEVLHNVQSGWHPHIHALLFVSGSTSKDQVDDFAGRFYARWLAGLERHGFDALPAGQRVVLIDQESKAEDLGTYLTKAGVKTSDSLGYEMTSTHSKSGRSIGRTQWELAAAAAGGGARDRMLWTNFEQATHGRRQMGWSRGIRDLARLGTEQSDEEIAAEEVGTDADTLVNITPDGWRRVCSVPGLAVTLLRVAEQDQAQLLRALDDVGVEYEVTERVSDDG